MKHTERGNTAAHRAYLTTRIPPQAMEVIADVLLASAGRDSESPAYNETQLMRKCRRSAQAEKYYGSTVASNCLPKDSDIAGLADSDLLNEDERAAWEMYAAGYRPSEIARHLKSSRPTVVRLLRSAARRLRALGLKYDGLSGIYHREVHRYVYRKPNHCSNRPCRRLGYCKFPIPLDRRD